MSTEKNKSSGLPALPRKIEPLQTKDFVESLDVMLKNPRGAWVVFSANSETFEKLFEKTIQEFNAFFLFFSFFGWRSKPLSVTGFL